jgi:hypothetical protein
MQSYFYGKTCNTSKLSEAIKRRFPNFSGNVTAPPNKTVIVVVAGLGDTDKPVLDEIVERHIASVEQARKEYDKAKQITGQNERQEAQVSVIARFLGLTDT